jgi:general stress protein CsbA
MKYVLGLFIPGALVIFFTRVTYSHVIGLLLTVALIAASVYKGYTDSLSLIIVDALSLTIGFAYSKMVRERAKKRS